MTGVPRAASATIRLIGPPHRGARQRHHARRPGDRRVAQLPPLRQRAGGQAAGEAAPRASRSPRRPGRAGRRRGRVVAAPPANVNGGWVEWSSRDGTSCLDRQALADDRRSPRRFDPLPTQPQSVRALAPGPPCGSWASASARVACGASGRSGSGTSGVRATISANTSSRAAAGIGRPSSGGARCSSKRSSRSSTAEHTGACGASSPTAHASRASASGSEKSARTNARPITVVRWVTTRSISGSKPVCGAPGRRAEVERVLAVEHAHDLLAHHRAQLLGAQPGLERQPHRLRRADDRAAVGRVARPHDVAGRAQRERRQHVGGRPPRGVDEQVRVVGQLAPQPRQVGDRAVGEDQPGVGELARQPHGVLPERRDAAAGVDQHRRLVLVRGRHELAHRRLGERELLRPRMQLDAVDAGVEAAPGLGHRAGILRLHAAQRAQAAAGRRHRLHHRVVGARVAVGLVHREHERLASRRPPAPPAAPPASA